MADPLDILSSIRAVLNGAGVGSSARPTSRVDTFGQAGYGTNSGDRSAEVDSLKWENRTLKASVDKLERELKELKSRPSADEAEIHQQRTLLVQAQDALVRFHSEIDTLKQDLAAQSTKTQQELEGRKAAEQKAHSATTQQSQLSKDKNLAEKRAEQLSIELSKEKREVERLGGIRESLSLENKELKHKMTNPARTPEFRAMQDSLARTNERAKAAETNAKMVQDQMKQLRLNNDGLRLQVQTHANKAEQEQKLTADKVALKHRIRQQEREIGILKDRNLSLDRQNWSLMEDFKERERQSQKESSRKKSQRGEDQSIKSPSHHPIHRYQTPPILEPTPPADPRPEAGSAQPKPQPKTKSPLSLEELVQLGAASVKVDPFKDLDKAFGQSQAALGEKVKAWRRPVEVRDADAAEEREEEEERPIMSSPDQSQMDFMYGGAMA